jgi:hypothetical protein
MFLLQPESKSVDLASCNWLVVTNVSEELSLGCLHPVARVISYDMGFNPSTQR